MLGGSKVDGSKQDGQFQSSRPRARVSERWVLVVVQRAYQLRPGCTELAYLLVQRALVTDGGVRGESGCCWWHAWLSLATREASMLGRHVSSPSWLMFPGICTSSGCVQGGLLVVVDKGQGLAQHAASSMRRAG